MGIRSHGCSCVKEDDFLETLVRFRTRNPTDVA